MRNFVGRLFIRYWVSEEEWFWTFQPFSKLETTFYKYWTSIKSLIHPFKSLLPLNSTSWIMFKRHICERKFHVSYHFFRYLWGLRRTNFINPSCSKHPKITKIKNFYFNTSFWCLKNVLWRPSTRLQEELRLCFCRTPDLCHLRFLSNKAT